MTFAAWKVFADQLAKELSNIRTRGALVVWRSNFLLKENALRSFTKYGERGYVRTAHFNTDARRALFDSYIEEKMSQVGVGTSPRAWTVCTFGMFMV